MRVEKIELIKIPFCYESMVKISGFIIIQPKEISVTTDYDFSGMKVFTKLFERQNHPALKIKFAYLLHFWGTLNYSTD